MQDHIGFSKRTLIWFFCFLCFVCALHAITPDQQSYCVNAIVKDTLLMFIIENFKSTVLQKAANLYSVMELKQRSRYSNF